MQKLHISHNSRPQEENGAPIWWESRGCRGAEGSVSVDGSTVAVSKCRPGNRRGEIHQFEVWSAYVPSVSPFKVDSQVWTCRQCGFRQQTREMYFRAHRDRELRRAAVYTVKLSRRWGGKHIQRTLRAFFTQMEIQQLVQENKWNWQIFIIMNINRSPCCSHAQTGAHLVILHSSLPICKLRCLFWRFGPRIRFK